ncbi:type IV pilus twitching motility protein PilT [bacterium]|nr:type IV pilus twitching motility protein PilT [bacterium]
MDFDQSRQTLDRIAKAVKPHLLGDARWQFLSELLDDQPEEVKLVLKDHVDVLLAKMKPAKASDMDFGGPGCNEGIWYRVGGKKQIDSELSGYSVDETDLLILNLITESERKQLMEQRNIDFSYRIRDHEKGGWSRFRSTIYFDMTHLAVNMRRVNDAIIPFNQLGFNENTAKALSLRYEKSGLVLITGITGSGKSTTLDSIIDANNRTMESHIVIIADPIEYVHQPAKSIVKHREVGRDVHSFKEGTIQALRQDPDIIMIGEMRDPGTIMTVLEVADSGHKVFSTLHTSSAVESIDRILGEIPTHDQQRIQVRLADILSCVISQKLVATESGELVLAKEVMLTTPAIRNAIRNNNLGEIYQIIHQSGDQGMHTMEQDLARLHAENKISYFEAYVNANNKKRFEELVKYSL